MKLEKSGLEKRARSGELFKADTHTHQGHWDNELIEDESSPGDYTAGTEGVPHDSMCGVYAPLHKRPHRQSSHAPDSFGPFLEQRAGCVWISAWHLFSAATEFVFGVVMLIRGGGSDNRFFLGLHVPFLFLAAIVGTAGCCLIHGLSKQRRSSLFRRVWKDLSLLKMILQLAYIGFCIFVYTTVYSDDFQKKIIKEVAAREKALKTEISPFFDSRQMPMTLAFNNRQTALKESLNLKFENFQNNMEVNNVVAEFIRRLSLPVLVSLILFAIDIAMTILAIHVVRRFSAASQKAEPQPALPHVTVTGTVLDTAPVVQNDLTPPAADTLPSYRTAMQQIP
ncbi:hypothetical protein BV898_14520 [Hypsibius exemplaris]|uniref:Transmembrane protein n=1 Tax=Hypsibius exemplaris TaxID=2072580 RepID=A0A9X6NCA8_HYPEX|nr:hypothetical protein BV898_14520 [Hypsibius exemplaris]